MKRRLNWPLWSGLLLAVIAFLSYFFVFALYPVTRDVPWASFLLFAGALALLVTGWRRAPRKIVASIVTLLGVAIIGMFTFVVLVATKDLPRSANAPATGEKVAEFKLADTNGRMVSLSSLLSGSNGVLLVFYRGYW